MLHRAGEIEKGRPFTKVILRRLLKNVLYIGKVSHQDVVCAARIIEDAVWKLGMSALWRPSLRLRRRAGLLAAFRCNRRASGTGATVTRLLALALKFEELIRSGRVNSYVAVAQVAHVSRSRVTQMTALLTRASDIQEAILFLRAAEARQLLIAETEWIAPLTHYKKGNLSSVGLSPAISANRLPCRNQMLSRKARVPLRPLPPNQLNSFLAPWAAIAR